MRLTNLGLGAVLALSLGACGGSNAQSDLSWNSGDATASVSSPDGRLEFTLDVEPRTPVYSVTLDDAEVIRTSRLGLRFAAGQDLTDDFQIVSVETNTVDTSWEQPWGERRIVVDQHEELLVSLADPENESRRYDLRVRLFDDGVAFRYEVPDTGVRKIVDEITEFTIQEDATSWWTPAGEFNRYEYIYRTTPVRTMERAHTPYTARYENGTHVAIHEAALRNYGGMWLDQRRAGKLEAEIAPRHDGVKVLVDGAFVTPWRVIQIGDTASDLINGTDIYLNLNEPNALGDVPYVETGVYAGIWWGMHINKYTWGSGEKHGATTENAKKYIDFAAENGMIGVLIEGWNIGWDGDWFHNGDLFSFTETYPDFDIAEVARYAREKGVRLIGHHETSGSITNYEDQMEAGFDLYQEHGVTTVKSGYVADASDLKFRDEDGNARYTWHDAQESVDHHERVLRAAHERGISINAHEPVKDTGLRRTFPNAITREGARGMEFNAWGTPPNPAEHTAILPFTRMLSGPMDFTPGIFDLTPNGPDNENRVNTTLAKQLSLYVVLYSPIQMAADLPENYAKYPQALQFIRDVVADWEESIALQGEVGDYTVIARKARANDEWFLGALTDEDPRDLTVSLDFLDEGVTYTAEVYRDGPDAHFIDNPYDIVIEQIEVTSTDSMDLPLGASGGAAVRFVPVE